MTKLLKVNCGVFFEGYVPVEEDEEYDSLVDDWDEF